MFCLNSFFLSFGRDPHPSVWKSDARGDGTQPASLLISKTVSPRIPVVARCTGHVRIMCSAVCSTVPHLQFDVGARPHLCMND